jgi:hypothetical protein
MRLQQRNARNLMNPSNPNATAEQEDAQAGAKRMGRETLVLIRHYWRALGHGERD